MRDLGKPGRFPPVSMPVSYTWLTDGKVAELVCSLLNRGALGGSPAEETGWLKVEILQRILPADD
jgi:hypothetical protein